MKTFFLQLFLQRGKRILQSFLGAVTFYTQIPLPAKWGADFQRIARWAPLIGILIGGLLGILDTVLDLLGIPNLTRSAVLVALWVVMTGGLHLDGAIDSADGLAVSDPERRLTVMRDSVTGAFGVMAAVVLVLLKTAALSNIDLQRWLILMMSAGWGRWGQLVAIAFYPYLRPTGKGSFHKEHIRPVKDIVTGLLFLLGCMGIYLFLYPQWLVALEITIAGSAIALLTGYWFYRQFKGHTGDTYGAVVEVRFVG